MGDVADYLNRLDSAVERSWLVDQISYLGFSGEQVGAALALAVANGEAGFDYTADGTPYIWPKVRRP